MKAINGMKKYIHEERNLYIFMIQWICDLSVYNL